MEDGRKAYPPYFNLGFIMLEKIQNGDRSTRLHLREYDNLDNVQSSFNEVLDQLTSEQPSEQQSQEMQDAA